jgi:hypothetical protein
MRGLAGTLLLAIVCCANAAYAEVNYAIFPRPIEGAGTMFSTGANVLRFRDSSVYDCVAGITDGAFTLKCNKQQFGGSIMHGDTVSTIFSPSGYSLSAPAGGGFWQLDQATGDIQFCLLTPSDVSLLSYCATTKIR